jgi:hypothetical protein
MDAQDLHSNKLNLINWITRLQDASILNELMKIQSRNEENVDIKVPRWHQEKVLNRIKSTKTEEYIPFDDLDDLMSVD